MSISYQEILAIFILSGFLGLAFVAFLVFSTYRYSKKQAEFQKEVASLKTTFEQSIAKAQLDMQEETLSAISDKLHDDVKNGLYAVKGLLTSMAAKTEGKNKTDLQEIIEEVAKIAQEVRLTSHSLKTDRIANIGLAEAIEYEAYLLKKQASITIELEKNTNTGTAILDEKNTVYLFRMFQETMGNVIAHAQATYVKVKLLYPAKDTLELSIIDNGIGFNVKESRKKTSGDAGIGLAGLYKRAFQIGAAVDIKSKKGEGTTVKIQLPLAS
ncbi:MAG: hypothetical protein JST29_08275 [Bacteroidetes bacterium]|nr:hypothetical protein [Bacteroidota bacterium]MBS1641650.1 hypothetical protein [Bacteroidota bacterium]